MILGVACALGLLIVIVVPDVLVNLSTAMCTVGSPVIGAGEQLESHEYEFPMILMNFSTAPAGGL